MRTRILLVTAAALCILGASAVAAPAVIQLVQAPERQSYGNWAPGVAAPVSAIDAARSQADTPPSVVNAVRRMAEATGGDPATASQSIRALRANIGRDNSALYAFKPDGTATCLILWKRSSICPTTSESPHPGVLWMISGGYPAWARADGVPIPDAVVGLVADNVNGVTLIHRKSEQALDISANAFFAELESRDSEDQLRVTYDDGQTTTIPIG